MEWNGQGMKEGNSKMMNRESIRQFIVDTFLFGNGDWLEENTSFLESGVIDSTGILELIMFLEETYSITIADDELIPENLDSISNIANFLEEKLAEKV